MSDKPIDSPRQRLLKDLERAKAALRAHDAKRAEEARRRDSARAAVLGAWMLQRCDKDEKLRKATFDQLEAHLVLNRERELFGFKPLVNAPTGE